jgi:diguanylate cyclase (GGDEF)-like protein
MFFELGERDPVMAAFVSDAGLVALAAVPIIAQDTLMALLAVGVKRDPERLRRSPELIEKLNGVAALAAPALQNRHLLDELHHQVLHDALTGVLNRTGFGRSLERILAGDQGPMPQAGLLFLDVDGFKALNDEHGHHVGDRLLCEVSERLRQTLRGDDRVARLGGDEFAVVLPRVHSPEEVHIAANRAHDAFAKPFRIEDMLVTVRVSVGEAVAPQDGTTIEELVRRADAAMYRQKALQRSELLRRHSTA